LEALSRKYKVIGIDESAEAVNLARRVGFDNVHHCRIEEFVRQNDPVDVVLALDVIEHIQDDLAAVIQIRKALRPGGLALITVPAFPSLWSPYDEVNHHYRRYTRKGLKSLISEAGLSCQLISFFNTILFPVEAAAKIYDRLRPRRAGLDYNRRSTGILNWMLERTFAFERSILAYTNLPFGISLLAVARKTGGA
jgi:SAM-dependent methyltransferase